MNPSPNRPYLPRTSPYGRRGARDPPRPFTPSRGMPSFYSPPRPPGHQQQFTPPLPPNYSTPPPPWSGGFSPASPSRQYFNPQGLLPSNPATPVSLYGTPVAEHSGLSSSSPTSFYYHPDMPSPMVMPPQKRKRFTPIRGRGGLGRQQQQQQQQQQHNSQHNRSFRGGGGFKRGRGRGAGIDAYYDRFMFEDPWRDLMPAEKEDTSTEAQSDLGVHASTRATELTCDGNLSEAVKEEEEVSLEQEANDEECRTSSQPGVRAVGISSQPGVRAVGISSQPGVRAADISSQPEVLQAVGISSPKTCSDERDPSTCS